MMERFANISVAVSLVVTAALFLALLAYSLRGELSRLCGWIRSNKGSAIFLAPMVVAMVCYGSTKPDDGPTIITEEGINLKKCVVSPSEVRLEWSTTDERITLGTDTFKVQMRSKAFPFKGGWSAWKDIGETTGTNYTFTGFTVDRNNQFRIAVEKELDDL